MGKELSRNRARTYFRFFCSSWALAPQTPHKAHKSKYMSGGINSIQCCFSIGLLQVEKNGFFKSTFDLFKSIRFRYPRGCRHLQVNAQVVVATKHYLETSETNLKKVEKSIIWTSDITFLECHKKRSSKVSCHLAGFSQKNRKINYMDF